MAISGLVAAGVGGALDEIQEQRLAELARKLEEEMKREQLQLQRDSLASLDADRQAGNALAARQSDLSELKRRDDNNARGMEMMQQDRAAMDTDAALSALPPHLKQIGGLFKIGAVGKLSPEDMQSPEERANALKAAEEREIRIRQASIAPRQAEHEWVVRGGNPVQIPKGSAQPGDRPYDAVAERSRGAETGPSPYASERANRTVQAVDNLMSKVNRWTTGAGSILSALPETDARNFAAELNTLKANVAFNELAAMRDASKTGGALGAVSEKEMALLESALGALDQGQSPQNLKTQLQQIKDSVQRWQQAAWRGGATGAQDVAFVFNPATGKLEPVRK